MSIWDLYKKPASFEGAKVDGLDARYYTGREGSTVPAVASDSYLFRMGFYYFLSLGTYFFCTKNGMRAQRFTSSATIAAVPFIILCHLKGDDSLSGVHERISLQERLDLYPITRRALERAIEDVSKAN
jgi:hypothetical protein